MSAKIKISREDFVKNFVEVSKPPACLTEKLQSQPLCHILSQYVIRPVACDTNPFFIHHKNKQPVVVHQKRNKPPTAKEVDNFDSDNSNDEFEKVSGEKKRK